ncbi:hypothetical protein EV139_0905 [Leucobacter luti]|uniref:Uncharacterized protein n=1 Tax=Leucobacter luti TaxID=340320 RepID=A0A4Q7U2W5_9MICO|nr:hypothetical protein EV139_0905 [Leucobacter luti]
MTAAGLFNGLSILIYIGMFACVYFMYRWEERRGKK